MTHQHPRPHIDPFALAARLRQWVTALVLWLAEVFGEKSFTRSLLAWVKHDLDRAERGAKALVVLAAVRRLPDPLKSRRTRRPLSTPRGFARRRTRDTVRGLAARLFPRERDLAKRARRLDDFLDTFEAHVARMTKRAAKIPPATRLVLVAPPAMQAPTFVSDLAPIAQDTS